MKRTSRTLACLLVAASLGPTGFTAEQTKASAEAFLTGSSPAPAKVAAPKPEQAAPEGSGSVEKLRDRLQTDSLDELKETARAQMCEAAAELTCGPEKAELLAEVAHAERRLASLQLGFGDINQRVDKERKDLAARIEEIKRSHKPGTEAFQRAVTVLVDHRRPLVDKLAQAATRYPQAVEDIKARLEDSRGALACWELLHAELARSPGTIDLFVPSSASDRSSAPPGPSEESFSRAQEWLAEQGITLTGSPAPSRPAEGKAKGSPAAPAKSKDQPQGGMTR